MTPDQATLISQVAFIGVIIVPTMIVTGVGVYVAIKVMPVLLKQAQQLIDNNTKLTKIAADNALALNANTVELVKQTSSIEKQTESVQQQSVDFKSYQSLVNDGLSNYGVQLDANTASIASNTAAITMLQTMFSNLPNLIVTAIQDKLTCDKVLTEVQSLRAEFTSAITQQQKRSTETLPAVVPPPNGSFS